MSKAEVSLGRTIAPYKIRSRWVIVCWVALVALGALLVPASATEPAALARDNVPPPTFFIPKVSPTLSPTEPAALARDNIPPPSLFIPQPSPTLRPSEPAALARDNILLSPTEPAALARDNIPPPTSFTPPTSPYGMVGEAPPARASARPIQFVDVPAPVAASDPGLTLADPAGTNLTTEKVQAEIKKFAWTKGDFTIVPYGTLWVNTVYETARTYPGDYTVYVLSKQDEGEKAFHVEARSTRLGFDVTGPCIPFLNGAQSGGKVEIDFQGSATTENKGALLLRHAYLEVKDDTFRILAGQTWDVMSPLIPGMLMYSVGWDGGNIGYRRPQVRLERYVACSDDTMLIAQGSINANIANDTIFADLGDRPGWPTFEGRVALRLGQRGPECNPIEIGVSGHIGTWVFDLPSVLRPGSVNLVRQRRRSHSDQPAARSSRRILHG